MRRPASTFYFHENRNPRQEKAYNVLKRMERKKLDFLIWLINVTEMTYGVDFNNMSKKEILALMKTPVPQQDQMSQLLERLSNALSNHGSDEAGSINKSREVKEVKEALNQTNAANHFNNPKSTVSHDLTENKDNANHIIDDNAENDELSASQSNMLFEGLSGFNI